MRGRLRVTGIGAKAAQLPVGFSHCPYEEGLVTRECGFQNANALKRHGRGGRLEALGGPADHSRHSCGIFYFSLSIYSYWIYDNRWSFYLFCDLILHGTFLHLPALFSV